MLNRTSRKGFMLDSVCASNNENTEYDIQFFIDNTKVICEIISIATSKMTTYY